MKLNKEQVVVALEKALVAAQKKESADKDVYRKNEIGNAERQIEYHERELLKEKGRLARLKTTKDDQRPYRNLAVERIEWMLRLAKLAEGPITITGAFRDLAQYL